MRFSVIIPNYNSEPWIIRLLNSIYNQTFCDYEVIIIDDMSTDNSVDIIKNCMNDKTQLIKLKRKRYNGGTRNEGVDYAKGEYILFVDCDDYFYSDRAFEIISKIIDINNKPDLVRLPYRYKLQYGEGNVMLHENTIEELTASVFVAPWTKCIKRELFVPFPENTLIEDVSQHIEQMDKINTIAYCDIPVCVWNRLNKNAISDLENEEKSIKRKASYWRIIADLMDLEGKLQHSYCEEQRLWRLQNYKDMMKQRL